MISPGGSKGAFFRQMFDTVFVMLFLSSCAQDLNQEVHYQNLGWFTVNGYRYKTTTKERTWFDNRRVCQSWGGDLAVHGVQTKESRKIIIEALSLSKNFWAGATDGELEESWVWVNGDIAASEQLLWAEGEPNSPLQSLFRDEDCLVIRPNPYDDARSNDYACSGKFVGLCEQKI